MPTTAPATMPASMPTTGPATTQATLTWDQAAQHIGETATVTGSVIGTHALSDGKHLLLNVGKDYPDPTRLTIFMTLGDNPPDADATYTGKTVTVTGKIELYHKAAEIRANAADVMVQK